MSDSMGAPSHLHPATLIARWLKVVPQMLIGGIGIAASGAERGLDRFLMFAGVAMGIGALFVVLAWWRFTFTVGDGEVVIEKGIVQRQRRVIPFDRIQDIAIEQRLLARLFGTAKVKLETGGSAAETIDSSGSRSRRTVACWPRPRTTPTSASGDWPRSWGRQPVRPSLPGPRTVVMSEPGRIHRPIPRRRRRGPAGVRSSR